MNGTYFRGQQGSRVCEASTRKKGSVGSVDRDSMVAREGYSEELLMYLTNGKYCQIICVCRAN
jgi:hypothetical protein